MSQQGNPATTPTPLTKVADAAVPWLLGVILVFAPLFRSGQPALAVLTLELLAVGLLVLILLTPLRDRIKRVEIVALSLLFLLPALYLVSLPTGFAELLPGRQLYLAGRSVLSGEEGGGLVPLSLFPLETESALLLLLLPISVFLATRVLDPSQALRLVVLLLAIASFQALLGLLQYGASEGSPQLLGMTLPDIRSASGTYTNRNHLAGLLEMVLPISLALVFYSAGRGRSEGGQGWKDRLTFTASVRGHTAFVYGAIALLLLIGLVFTRSRTGIALSMLALVLSTIAFARHIGGTNLYGSTGTIIALTVGIAIAIGLIPVLDRFSAASAIRDARWAIFSTTLDGIGAFLPIGSGLGTYPHVFPAFQPWELGKSFINHVHNDFLEWLFEGGLLAAALIFYLLSLYARRWAAIWSNDEWSRFYFVQVAAGIGILLMLVHSLVDYNLHMPANMAYFAFLAGLFFSESVATANPQRRKHRRTPKLEYPASVSQMAEEEPIAAADQASSRGATIGRDHGETGTSPGAVDGLRETSEVEAMHNRIGEAAVALTGRTPRLLLVELDEDSGQQQLASATSNLEHRIKTYAGTVLEQVGECVREAYQSEEATPESATEEGSEEPLYRRMDALTQLEAEIEAMIAAVDAFVDRPDEGGLSAIQSRLDAAEQRLQGLGGAPSKPPTIPPQAGRWGSTHHPRQVWESRSRPSPRAPALCNADDWESARETASRSIATDQQPGSTSGATPDSSLATLGARVRYLETRIKLGSVFLLIAGGLAAASLWWTSRIASNIGREDATRDSEAAASTQSVSHPVDPESNVARIDLRIASLEARIAEFARGAATESSQMTDALVGEGKTPIDAAETTKSESSGTSGVGSEGLNRNFDTPGSRSEGMPGVAETRVGRASDSQSATPRDVTLKEARFGIQLIAIKNHLILKEFVQRPDLPEDTFYARSPTRDDLYILVQGLYQTREEAEKAKVTLPPGLKSLKPWVKQYPAGIQFHRIEGS